MKITISDYLVRCLKNSGCNHVMGIPGTSCADFFFALDKDPDIDYFVTTNELEAGYMADGYGRFRSLAAVCVSYGVGTLSLVNAVASAFTEKVPMIILNGGPSHTDLIKQDAYGILFSHSTGMKDTDHEVFKNITVASLVWRESNTVEDINWLFSQAIYTPGPVYLEVPRDKWNEFITLPQQATENDITNESESCKDFIDLFQERLSKASNPALLIGSEIIRRGLQDELQKWINYFRFPYATTLLAKSALSESSPFYIGTYDSDLAPKSVRQYIEGTDCLITFGCVYGVDHTVLIEKQYQNMVDISYGIARIGNQKHQDIPLSLFLKQSLKQSRGFNLRHEEPTHQNFATRRSLLTAKESDICTYDTIFTAINLFINAASNSFVVVTDTFLGNYPAADLEMPSTNMFLGNPIWLSIGQGTPAGSGAYLASGKRPLIITGDGGFQMIAATFSTMIRYQIPAIIIVIDNGIYGIEQFLIDNTYYVNPSKLPIRFNQLNRWHYEAFPSVFGGGMGARATTITEFTEILKSSLTYKDGPSIIALDVSPKDLPAENLKFIIDGIKQ